MAMIGVLMSLRMKNLAVGIVLLLATTSTAVACDDGSAGPASTSSTSPSTTSVVGAVPANAPLPRVLLDAPDWTLREAVDGDLPVAGIGTRPISWYAESQRLEPDVDGVVGSALTTSGISIELNQYRAVMEQLGFSFEPVDTPFGPSLSGTTDESGARPVVVVVTLGPGVLELLSYDESADQLIALLDDTSTVDDAEWRAAGGRSN
jgi:hypothetical protein